MHEDQHRGSKDPLAGPRTGIVTLAASTICIVCGGNPCYMLAKAAQAKIQEEFLYNEDLKSIEHYMQDLEKVQQCLNRHKEIAGKMYQEYKELHPPETLKGANENGRISVEGQNANLHAEARDPPSLN